MEQTGRDLVAQWGSCIVHETFRKKIVQLKIEHPSRGDAHPECESAVLRHASYIGSTTALLYKQGQTKRFYSSHGAGYHSPNAGSHKHFIPAPPMVAHVMSVLTCG